MKYLIYPIIALFFFASCSRSKVIITESEMPEDIFYLEDQLEPFSGECIIYYPGTKKIKEKFTFHDGILHGPAESYYSNETLKRSGQYNMGRLDGKWESWHENGSKNYEVIYQNDSLCGDYTCWYNTGVIKEKGEYTENARKGVWVEYDEAGMILKKRNFN